jgi:hypothetical protein
MIRFSQLAVFMLLLQVVVFAQEPLKHEKKIYVNPEGKVFVSKDLPVYFKVSLTPNDSSPSYVLPSEKSAKYANPMYFDTEGENTLRSPSAVDPKTKKMLTPKQDVLFDVYADGFPPSTKIKLHQAHFTKNSVLYFGQGYSLEFEAFDKLSGIAATYVSINGSKYQNAGKSQIVFNEEKEYSVLYYSVDNVGNEESPKNLKFCIDLKAPITSFKIIGESKGNVLSSKASISFSSKDTLSGLKHIMYSINDGAEKVYTAPIPLSVLKDGKSKIHYYAVDNVGNKEETKVIAASTESVSERLESADPSAFNFYIDNDPPVMALEIIGDQAKGKYLYISERSRVKINATDDKSGVGKIEYSINNVLLKDQYSEPFALAHEGLNTIVYAASDNVGNFALAQTQQVYLDKHIPNTHLSFKGKQFVNRDTTFITDDTQIVLTTSETGSGVQEVEYVLDNNGKVVYGSPVTVKKNGFHTLTYQAKDKVNNIEALKSCSFFIDNIPPQIFAHFSVTTIGKKVIREENYDIYPSNAILYIAATDNASGGEKIEYRINGKEWQSAMPVKGFVPGNYEVEINAYDVLKNKSTKIIRFAIEN